MIYRTIKVVQHRIDKNICLVNICGNEFELCGVYGAVLYGMSFGDCITAWENDKPNKYCNKEFQEIKVGGKLVKKYYKGFNINDFGVAIINLEVKIGGLNNGLFK